MKRLFYIILLMLLPVGMLFAQNGVSSAKVPGNIKPVSKSKGANESKPAPLPLNVKPVEKSKTAATKPTIAPLPNTVIKK